MFKLRMTYLSKHSVLIDRIDLLNRPHITYLNPNVARVLRKSTHDWFIENNIQYNLELIYVTDINGTRENPKDYYIVFESKKDAMLFKLTWINV